jgi:hypothetical protein
VIVIAALFGVLTITSVGVRARDVGLNRFRIVAAMLLAALCMASQFDAVLACVWYFFAAAVLMLVDGKFWSTIAIALAVASALLLVQGAPHPLWTSPPALPAIGAFGIIALAAAGGVLRRGLAEGIVFGITLVAAIYDVRLAPLFAIAAAPMVLAAL